MEDVRGSRIYGEKAVLYSRSTLLRRQRVLYSRMAGDGMAKDILALYEENSSLPRYLSKHSIELHD